jgi:hypothetical protein
MDLETINILDTFLNFSKTHVIAGGSPLDTHDFKRKNAGEFILNIMDQNDLYFTSSHKKSEKKSAINQIVDLLETTVEKLNEMNLFDFLLECSEKEVRINHREKNPIFGNLLTSPLPADSKFYDGKKYFITSSGNRIVLDGKIKEEKEVVDQETQDFIDELSNIDVSE